MRNEIPIAIGREMGNGNAEGIVNTFEKNKR
jgi:hypothetical protein